MKALLGIVGLVFAASGCVSQAADYDVYISPGYTQEEYSEIVYSMGEWARMSDHLVSFSFHYADDDSKVNSHKIVVNLVTLAEANDISTSHHCLGTTFYFTVSDTSYIYLPDSTELGIYFSKVVAHETGHALGLGHSGSNEAIMYPYINTNAKGVTCIDVQNLRVSRGDTKFDYTCTDVSY